MRDQFILETIAGCRIDLNSEIDRSFWASHIPFTPQEAEAIDLQVAELLKKHAFAPTVWEPGDFVSNIFVVSKKDNKFQMILNLKKFNSFVDKISFKMETLDTILQLVTPLCFMMSVDLSDAYLSIAVHISHRHFLKFSWRGSLYQFLAMPFGLTSAPRIFTKVLKAVLAYLRGLGFVVMFYLDDGWQKGDTFQECLDTCQATYTLLVACGFIPNVAKSSLIPSQQLEILGHLIDSVSMTISLPQKCERKILKLFKSVLKSPTLSIRKLAKVVGTMVSCFRVCPLEQTHYRSFECLKVSALQENGFNWEAMTTLTSVALADLEWWIQALPGATAPISRPNPTITLFTDASSYAWGGVLDSRVANGHFSERELPLSINTKETLAI